MGRFDFVGIPPAPRGIPQVEVTFDIDANGIVNVSAKDLGTGKEQKITVSGSSNLSDKDLKKMQEDAKQHEAEDKVRREEIETINQADSIIYTTEKSMKDMEGKVDKKQLDAIQKKLDELKKSMEPEKRDIAAVKKRLDELNEVAQKAAVEMYQKASAEKNQEGKKGKKDDEAVDAEVVDEDK